MNEILFVCFAVTDGGGGAGEEEEMEGRSRVMMTSIKAVANGK